MTYDEENSEKYATARMMGKRIHGLWKIVQIVPGIARVAIAIAEKNGVQKAVYFPRTHDLQTGTNAILYLHPTDKGFIAAVNPKDENKEDLLS